MRKFTKTLTAAGAEAGKATAEDTLELHGTRAIYAIILDYTGLPATTDVVVTDGAESVSSNVLTQANSNTDKVYYPRAVAAKSADGSASTLTEACPVAESLKISVKEGDPGGTLAVTVITAAL